jgi:uncharacterized membrane protein YeaQ/YmgE (transglycosylase-associated protein family)
MQERNTIEALITGGIIGAVLGAILDKDKEEGAIVGALVGAAVTATLNANLEAQKTDQPVLVAEGSNLYRIMPGGEKQFVKRLPPSSIPTRWPFKLK